MPDEKAVWKWIALGQASIATGELERADSYLEKAFELQPDHPLAYYLRGVLRLQQSRDAYDWPDVPTTTHVRLVAVKPQPVVPNTRSMYELAATMDFEMAIQLASTVQVDESIVPSGLVTTMALEPTVGDLILALSLENFEAKAHGALGEQFLTRGSLELAEEHFDNASGSDVNLVEGYRHLAEDYRARGHFTDAMRAYLKSMKVRTENATR